MKTREKKSLSSVLYVLISIAWWLEWVALGTLIAMGSVAASIRRAFALQIPISFDQITLGRIPPTQSIGNSGILNTSQGIISYTIDADWRNCATLLFFILIAFAGISLITYQLKAIFRNFKDKVPFIKSNIWRINFIAAVLILMSPILWLMQLLIYWFAVNQFVWKHIELQMSFNISFLLLGVGILVISEIFRMGMALEEDNKLTI